MLTGPLVVARDIAHAKIKERLDAGEGLPQYLRDHCVYYAGPGEDPGRLRVGLVRTDDRRSHGLLRRSVPAARRIARDARQGQSFEGGHRGVPASTAASTSARSAARRRASPRTASPRSRCSSIPSSAWKPCGRSRSRLPRVHRRRRQGQRLLRRRLRSSRAHGKLTPSRASSERLSATALRPPP